MSKHFWIALVLATRFLIAPLRIRRTALLRSAPNPAAPLRTVETRYRHTYTTSRDIHLAPSQAKSKTKSDDPKSSGQTRRGTRGGARTGRAASTDDKDNKEPKRRGSTKGPSKGGGGSKEAAAAAE